MSNRRRLGRGGRNGWARPVGRVDGDQLRAAREIAKQVGGAALVIPSDRPKRPPIPTPAKAPTFGVRDVIALRDEILDRCRPDDVVEKVLHNSATTFPYHVLPDGRRGSQWTVGEWMDKLRQWLAEAELFYVTPEMTTLVRRAAAAHPPYEVVPDRLPAKIGFVVYADTLCLAEANPDNNLKDGEQCRIMAALWAEVDDVGDGPTPEPGVMSVFFQDSYTMLVTRPHQYLPEEIPIFRGYVGRLAYHEEYPLPYGTELWGRDNRKAPRKLRNGGVAGLQATFIMMSQRVVHVTNHHVPGKTRREHERAGRPVPSLRTVTLRRAMPKDAPTQVHQPGQEGSRKYTHRWWVAGEDGLGFGYLRRTWYPSLQDHRLQYVWVPPYLKRAHATDDPILDTPKVNVLRR